MIRLISGKPGSGKTLRAVWMLHQMMEREESRPVYVWGVDGLRDGLAEALDDPHDWRSLPDGSLILIDEAQKIWPSRSTSGVPEDIRALSEHRHRGFDFVLITQRPSLLHPHVRALIGEHEHVVRRHGSERVTIYRWQEVQSDVDSVSKRKASEKRAWKYPRDIFGLYKSAEVHTHKRTIPRTTWIVGGLVIAFISLVGYAWWQLDDGVLPTPAKDAAFSGSAVAGVGQAMNDEQWLARLTPRFAAMPWSAPIYDDLEPAGVPKIYCGSIERSDGRQDRCRCYSEQMTPISVAHDQCMRIALYGIRNPFAQPFDDSGVGRRYEGQERQHARLPVPPVIEPSRHSSELAGSGLRTAYVPPGQ